MATYVLCHGGGMGAWVWKYVTPILRKNGHDVYPTTFTGFGERIHLIGRNVTTQTHVTDIVNVLNYEELTDVILVGHSYAGTVLPGVEAAVPHRVRRHVFVDSLVVHSGETVVEVMGFMPKDQAQNMAAMLQRGEGPVGSGVHEQQRELAKTDPLWMPPERQKWVLDHLSDMPLACTVTPVAVGAETVKKPADYMAMSHTIMKPMHPRARALGWKMHEFEADHSILVGQPDVTAEFLMKLA